MHSGTQRRPRLTPAVASVRVAVREHLSEFPADSLVLVALSGGRDSVALAAATAFEAQHVGLRAGAIIVDHGLQTGSAQVAEAAASTARALGMEPVEIVRITVTRTREDGGPEAAARRARYDALGAARERWGAHAIFLGHTLDDQAESVLLGLARGSGASSLSGMRARTNGYARPLLGIRRETTTQFCRDSGLDAWDDPHNDDPAYTRVRVRKNLLPALERELGPGVAEALARTARQLQEDADTLDALAEEWAEDVVEPADGGIAIIVSSLEPNPDALAGRIIRFVVLSEFGVALSFSQTREVLKLVRNWRGQKGIDLPGVRVNRVGGRLHFVATHDDTEGR